MYFVTCTVLANECKHWSVVHGLYPQSGKTYCRQISWSVEAARLDVIMIISLWNLTGFSAALLPRCLSDFRAIGKVKTRISRLRDLTRSYGKTSVRLVKRGPVFDKTYCLFVISVEAWRRQVWLFKYSFQTPDPIMIKQWIMKYPIGSFCL